MISHRVLESLTKSGAILHEEWQQALESEWRKATHTIATEMSRHRGAIVPPPEEWEGYQIKLARLRKTARRLHELLAPLGEGVELITEQPLQAANGRLQGRPDLIARTSEGLWLLDYKSGPVVSRETREPRESYVRQLRLYAFLVAESLDEWPCRALLVPLQGPVIDIEIDRAACESLANQAIELLEAFNAQAPAVQPASPAPETCQWCPYAPACPGFWTSCTQEWAAIVLAAAGSARLVTRPALGGVSLIMDAEAGSLEPGMIKVRAISTEEHPAVAALREGVAVALVGLRPDRDTSGFVLPDYGHAAVWAT